MDQLPQPSYDHGPNPSTFSAKGNAEANRGNVSGRTVSGESLGVNFADFTSDPVTEQKQIGISSRAVVLNVDTPEVAKRKLDVTHVHQNSKVTSRFETFSAVNTAILTDKQAELIQKLVKKGIDKLTQDELMTVVDYLPRTDIGKRIDNHYLESPILMKEFVRTGVFHINQIPKDKLTKDLLLAHPKYKFSRLSYDDLPEELKNDVDFLIEYSSLNGIPYRTPPELAVFVYEYLDVTAKIESLGTLPEYFKNQNDDLYNELIRSGMIAVGDLPEHIKRKNKEYCLSQLSHGFCELSEVPAQFITKEAILDSLNDQKWAVNYQSIFSNQYSTFTKDPVFFEEVLIKIVTAELETNNERDQLYRMSLYAVYDFASKRYKADEEKLGLLLKKLVKANPFLLIVINDLNDTLLQELNDTAKDSLLDILRIRPGVSKGFEINILYFFFEKVNADNDFKTHALNVVHPYFPEQKFHMLPEEILKKQDDIVLKSEPFDKGKLHFLNRKLRPENPGIVLDYIERYLNFVLFFNNKKYLENCCTDPKNRQRLIQLLAERLVADKEYLVGDWKSRLPLPLLADTLDFLKDPALFFKLDSSGKLAEPVNPLNFQLSNTSAFELVVAAHAFDFHPAQLASGRQLQSEFARAGETVFESVYSGQDPLSLFEKEGSIVGGRTLAICNGEEVDYYKFQRVGESVSTLAQEGIMHQFIAKSDRFKSRKPRFGEYLVVLEKDLPESCRSFTDRLQVSYVNGERAFRVYHFKATNSYGKYAHIIDDTSTPYATAEQGLLNSIHDIGVLNGKFGVMPTSTIPAFHFTGRRWVFLSPLLGNSTYFASPLPGKFESWIKAIERPDFGWDGLRDWGDVEFYGSMKSGLGTKDSKTWGYSPEVMQRLSFANALCENMLAAVLLRSRLRRDSQDYYYQNQLAVKETENFIEQLLNEYLSGLFAKEKELQPKSRLQSFMGLDDNKYHSWLTRTAQEILYWTALQPCEVTDPDAFPPSVECYSEHLKQKGRLDTMLYPEPLHPHPTDTQKKFPRHFSQADGQLNLGASNAVFPLVALSKGLTLFASNVFAFADQYTEVDNME